MMKIGTKTIMLALIVSSLSLFSCGKKSAAGCAVSASASFTQEAQAVSDASAAFSASGSAADCERYKDALRDYVRELQKFYDCYSATTLGVSYKEIIDESLADIDDIEC